MKPTNKLPLRWRITIMTGAIVLISNLCMMFVSIHTANTGFDVVLTNVSYYYQNSYDAGSEVAFSSFVESQEESEDVTDEAGEKARGEVMDESQTLSKQETDVFYVESQEEIEDYYSSELSDADAASSSIYFPDNSSVSRKFNLISVITMFVTTLSGMLIAYVLSARALRPIKELNQSVLEITGSNLNRRVEESGVRDEVGSLQKSFNSMMNRLEDSFNRQKEFSRNVAHELKTPLTTMKTGIQVLHMDEKPSYEEMKHVLDVTEKNIDRLISIVQDLLLFTKEEHVEFNDEIELCTLLMQILEEHKKLADEHKITLHLECEQDYKIMQNEALLTRALTNLIENAIKYNKEQGRVDVRVMKQKHELVIQIEDTGIGMDQTQLDSIWDPFYCVDESRSRRLGGAGIGLALVRSISEKCGFEVNVKSIREKGSIFTIVLPLEYNVNKE